MFNFLYGEDGIDVAKSDHGEAFNASRLAESQTMIDSGKKATKDEIDTLTKKYTKTFNPRLTSLVTEALQKSNLSKEVWKLYVRKDFHSTTKPSRTWTSSGNCHCSINW